MNHDTASILPAGTVTLLVTDGSVAAFEHAADAVAAAIGLCQGSRRIAVHTGDAHTYADGVFTGAALRRCERLLEIAADGQTLLSARAAAEAGTRLPAGWGLHDLGLHRLRDLSSPGRIFELRQDGASTAGPLCSLDTVPNNLPVRLTSFVGRAAELAAVKALLAGERLVTIAGAGGCGKTRLASQVAAEAAENWPDGVWWVELSSAGDPVLVADLVASTVDVLIEPVQGAVRSLAVQLRDRRVLVCLDNCEHVLDGAAEVAEALLRSCPEAAVLTTSREPLGIPGEAVWRVPSLPGDEAVELFVERASLVRPWFTLDASSEVAVRTTCARLDGIPLAVELAAAWLGTLTPQQIESGLDDRFALLVRGPRGVEARQQTLLASIDWSHDLLDEPDRVVFRRLAAFGGGFTLDAARAVCGDEVLDSLGRLVDKSLVVAADARYRMLETIRQYAADRLTDAEEVALVCDRHLDHYLGLVEAAAPELDRDKDAWRARFEAEHDNLRAALDWGLSASDPDRGRRLAALLPWLWHLHGHGNEGLDVLLRAIGRLPDDRSPLQARLLTGLALVADTARPLELEFDIAQQGLAIATENGDEPTRRLCLLLSAVGRFYTDFSAGWELCREAGASAGDGFVRDGSRALQGIILHLRDEHASAEPLLSSSAEGLLARGDRGVAASAVSFQACGALYTGDLAGAQRLASRAVELAAPLGDYHRVGTTRSVLALVTGAAGDLDAAFRIMEPVLRLVEGAEKEVFVPGMARTLGMLHLWRGEAERARQLFEREAYSTDGGADTYLAAHALPGLATALRCLGRLDEASAVVDRTATVARSLGMPRILADAHEQRAHLCDPDRAVVLHHEALALRMDHGLRYFVIDSLEALAVLMARAGREADAVRIVAATEAARVAMSRPRCPAEEIAAGLRASLGAQAFGEAWAEGEKLSLDEAVAYLRRTRGSRGRPSTGWESLTPTELDVVRLVVAGLNNPEIGSRLFMSRGTVKTHLAHVFTKLGVANRTELATFAAGRLD